MVAQAQQDNTPPTSQEVQATQTKQNVAQQPTQAPQQQEYAGFFRRWAAIFLDGIILSFVSVLVLFPINFVIGILSTTSTTNGNDLVAAMFLFSGLANLLIVVIQVVYFTYFIGAKGQTPGKMALKVKVIRKDNGEVPGYTKAFLRELVGKFISSLIFGLGYFWMIWDKDKQTWHDKVANTVVIKLN